MMKRIVITYKNGSLITIDVPESYYKEKYAKKSDKRRRAIFQKDYNKFVKALTKTDEIIFVGKYLKFSQATASGQDVLSVDIKEYKEAVASKIEVASFPSVPEKIYLDLDGTKLEALLDKLNELSLIDNLDKLIQKLVSYFNKANVEFSIKAGKKPATTSRKKKSTIVTTVAEVPSSEVSQIETEQLEQLTQD